MWSFLRWIQKIWLTFDTSKTLDWPMKEHHVVWINTVLNACCVTHLYHALHTGNTRILLFIKTWWRVLFILTLYCIVLFIFIVSTELTKTDTSTITLLHVKHDLQVVRCCEICIRPWWMKRRSVFYLMKIGGKLSIVDLILCTFI